MKVNITGEMSQDAANKVKIIESVSSVIFKTGIVVSILLVASAYFYVNVLK